MNNQSDDLKPRPKIIDTQDYTNNNGRNPKQVTSSKNKKRFEFKEEVEQIEEAPVTTQYPIEMTPVMRAVLEYGRRTHALGALKGAAVVSNLVNQINALGQISPELKRIILDAEKNAIELKKLLNHAYAEK
jgi:hypothetical protein